MKLIAVATDNQDQAQFVLTSLQEAEAKGRMTLEDVALVRGAEVTHTKGRVSRMLGKGIEDDQVKRISTLHPDVDTFVFALGPAKDVDAVARRVRTVTKGEMRTFAVDGDDLAETTERDETFELEEGGSALLEEPGVAFQEGNLPHQRLSRP
jgi:hypothetical protein